MKKIVQVILHIRFHDQVGFWVFANIHDWKRIFPLVQGILDFPGSTMGTDKRAGPDASWHRQCSMEPNQDTLVQTAATTKTWGSFSK